MSGKTTDRDILQIAQEAGQWFCELDKADESKRAEFVAWVSTSKRHMEEFLRVSELDAVLKETLQTEKARKSRHMAKSGRSVPDAERGLLTLVETQPVEIRRIVKYPNRRLYDTLESRYVTLADIRQLVLECVDFVVIEKSSRRDITCPTLLQVVAEQEGQGDEPLFSRDFLADIVRSYDGGSQGVVSSYLEQSLKLLLSAEKGGTVEAAVSGEVMSTEAQNYQRWRLVQDEIHRILINGQPSRSDLRCEEKSGGGTGWATLGVHKD